MLQRLEKERKREREREGERERGEGKKSMNFLFDSIETEASAAFLFRHKSLRHDLNGIKKFEPLLIAERD